MLQSLVASGTGRFMGWALSMDEALALSAHDVQTVLLRPICTDMEFSGLVFDLLEWGDGHD